jgi:lauroyl/myristoyl acyltransferase
MTVPDAAVKAAFRAVGEAISKPNNVRKRQDIVRIALEAAAPHIAAAERERIRQFATQVNATYPASTGDAMWDAPFADLITTATVTKRKD